MKIRQHIPNYFEGFDPKESEFDTKEELLKIPWVKNWSKEHTFYQFSLSIHEIDHTKALLMAELEKGTEWWVVGYLFGSKEELENLSLPKWESKKK